MRFPNESDEYRAARDALLDEEIALRRHTEAVADQRRRLPLGGEVPTDYEFAGAGGTVRLSGLFEDGKDTLFLYNFMFIPGKAGLPLMPVLHLDHRRGRRGSSTHRAARQSRGHREGSVRAVSGARTHAGVAQHAAVLVREYDLQRRLFRESDRGQNPVATVFVRRDGKIHHFWSSELYSAPTEPGEHPRHVDFIWPLWAVLDRTPEGRGTDWGPELAYS
jgi:predicted dithiol-disulfide oxidoreductase (DUF899 family)